MILLNRINDSLFLSINRFAGVNPVLDAVIKLFAIYLPLIFIAVLLYYWFFKKTDDVSRETLLLVIWNAVLGLFINFLIGLFYFHPRPFMLHLGKLLIPHKPDSSFPSDHATFMFSISLAVFFFNKYRTAGIGLFCLAAIGGLSRVFTGVHFPFDIAGSLIVSIISTIIIFMLNNILLQVNQKLVKFYNRIFPYEVNVPKISQ
ncbi:MAG: undecaprenyl-diphosphatase [Candidatus Omnitrophica bacterium]|nr:undecaprenyl-diphosphatase [Candidatus Omnitrophota bacterium]